MQQQISVVTLGIADPDGHAWEIAWNPAWPISPEGYVTFGA